MRDYRRVEFSHIPTKPGEAATLTADPWSFARAHLNQAAHGRRGVKAANLRRALHYVRLAEGFYAAMEGAQTRTRGVLAYYGMLNLAKAFLSYRNVELETVTEHHGMTVPLGFDKTIRLFTPGGAGQINIFASFAEALGTPISAQTDVDFLDVCCQVPELHQLVYAGGHLQRRRFLPIKVDFLVTTDKKKLFAEFSYDKGHEGGLKIENFHKGLRAKYLKPSFQRGNTIVHQTVSTKSFTKKNWDTVYRNSVTQYNGWDIVSILTRRGYRYYCNLEPGTFHHLCYSLITMFFIGSISRYRPSTVEKTFGGSQRPIATEAMALVPKQFLYHMVSLITNRVCVVPYAML